MASGSLACPNHTGATDRPEPCDCGATFGQVGLHQSPAIWLIRLKVELVNRKNKKNCENYYPARTNRPPRRKLGGLFGLIEAYLEKI